MAVHNNQSVLICDVGGTNVRFGIYQDNQPEPVTFNGKYKCAYFPYFEAALAQYRHDAKLDVLPAFCLIGAAGDIDEQRGIVLATNTPWHTDISKVQQTFPSIKKIKLVNDFALQGWALTGLQSTQYHPLFDSHNTPDLKRGKVVLIGPGTGLGSCLIMPSDHQGQNVYTSEAGHNTIPYVVFPKPEDQLMNKEMLQIITQHYQAKGQQAVTEHLVSGTGLSNIFHALRDKQIPTEAKQRVPAEQIEMAAQHGDPIALKTFDFFNAYLGAHAGSMVATTKTDTLFFCGGVMASPWVRKNLEATSYFQDQFIPRSGLTQAMKRVKIYVSNYRDMSTLGAKVFAQNMLKEHKNQQMQTQNEQTMLHFLYYLQTFVDAHCPSVKTQMKDVVSAVQTFHNKQNSK